MNTNFYLPKEACIRSIIHVIWQVEGFHTFQQETILPKGVVEVIFNFSEGGPIEVRQGNRQSHVSRCFINGINRAPIQLQLPHRQIFFGVVFQPLAVKKIFNVPAGEFSDIAVDLSLLDSTFHSLWDQLAEQDQFDQRVAVVLGWLNRNLIHWQPQEQLINHFLYSDRPCDVSVTGLADTLCYSPRHLSRKLQEATGMGAEEVILYKKYLHAVDLMHQTELSLTEIAHHSHFTDQSHFIRTFKTYTGLTPGKYRKNRSQVKGHLYENVR